MKVFIIDSDREAVRIMEEAVREKYPESEIWTYSDSALAGEAVRNITPGISFVNIDMPGGREIAETVFALYRETNLIIISKSKYGFINVARLFPTYCMLSPVAADETRNSLNNLKYPVE